MSAAQQQKERLALALCVREAWYSNAGPDGQKLRNIIRHIEEAIGADQVKEIVGISACETCGALDHCTYEHVNEVSGPGEWMRTDCPKCGYREVHRSTDVENRYEDYPEQCFWKGCHKPRLQSESFCDEHLPEQRRDYKP